MTRFYPNSIYGNYFHNYTHFNVDNATEHALTALKAGFTAFDSATCSSYTEVELGRALQHYQPKRYDIWLQTKYSLSSKKLK